MCVVRSCERQHLVVQACSYEKCIVHCNPPNPWTALCCSVSCVLFQTCLVVPVFPFHSCSSEAVCTTCARCVSTVWGVQT